MAGFAHSWRLHLLDGAETIVRSPMILPAMERVVGNAQHTQLTKEDWQRVEALFPDLLALPPERHEAFYVRQCHGNAALRGELESLLAAADRGSVLDQPALQASAVSATAPVAGGLQEGVTLGAWRIERLLGRGGMGEVYLGERVAGGFEQRAAIKLLRVDAVEHVAHFESERRILAQLEHPNIARLLDGGIDTTGRAWMAMEYVDGETLGEYCRRQRPDLASRLVLFDAVCAAVAYAHARLIVHRDLKPSNILVTATGAVKLLDFGVARLLDRDADVTQTRSLMMTPAHAAPEQLEGRAVTIAADIYALGVLLYELLCGRAPWSQGDTLVAGMVSRLARGEPPPPSRAEVTDPAVPSTQLRGDLDAIVMRCLRQDPAARYPTVDALRDDITRWRRHEPVIARRGARGYVMRRWLRRHRTGVAAVALVLVALLGGLGSALWQARRAQQQATRTELVKGLVLSAFRENDPLSRPGADARPPAQLIADAVEIAERRFNRAPLLQAEVLGDLGEVQVSLGDPAGGRATLEKALALRRAGDGHADTVATATLMRKLASAMLVMGDHDGALANAQAAQAMLVRLGMGESAEMARAELASALVLENRRERERALQLTVDAQGKLEATLGHDDPETATAVFRRGQVLDQLRRDVEASTTLRDAVARIERSAGAGSARLILPLAALGSVLVRARPTDAIAVYERAAEIAGRELGPRNTTRAGLLNRMANAYRRIGRVDRAEAGFTQALAAIPAGDHIELAQLLASRGQLYLDTGRNTEAESDLKRAFELRRETVGDGGGITWYTASLWGSALRELGKLDEAERVQRDALAQLQKILGADAYQNTLLLDQLVETLVQRGAHAEAAALARRSLALTRKTYPAGHFLIADRSVRLAVALGASADDAQRDEASGLCRDAMQVLAGKQGREANYAQVQKQCAPFIADGDPA